MQADDTSHESGANEPYSRSNSNLGIERSTYEHGPEPWKDPTVLDELYHDRSWSQGDVADHFGIRQQTVCYWMDKLGIDTRPPMNERSAHISRSIREDGKTQYIVPDGEGERAYFYEHQLVALLEFEASDVFADGTHIHHEMGSLVGLDLPCNLDVLGDAEHVRLHMGGATANHPEVVLSEIFDDYDGEPDPEEMTNPLAASRDEEGEAGGASEQMSD